MKTESKEDNSNRDLKDSVNKFVTLDLLWKRLLTEMLIVASNRILVNKDFTSNLVI